MIVPSPELRELLLSAVQALEVHPISGQFIPGAIQPILVSKSP